MDRLRFQRVFGGVDHDCQPALDHRDHPGSHFGRGVAVLAANGGSRGGVGVAPPDAVPVFDGVFLLGPQLNDSWDLQILLQVDFQETLGCPTLASRT